MPWDIVYYKTRAGDVPVEAFYADCPTKVEAKLEAVLSAVAEAPPPQFSGGGMWEAMHGTMTGYYEVRVGGPRREQFRVFCILDRTGPGLPGPAIAVIHGMRKRWMTVFTEADYAAIREMGDDYKASSPRRIAD